MVGAGSRHETAFNRAHGLASQLMEAASKDMLSVETTAKGSSEFKTKTTVGMMLSRCVVENCVVGGPAALSKQLEKGDTIVKVDDVPVSRETISAAVIGDDRPGSTVKLDILKNSGAGGQKATVFLKRMRTEVFAERRALGELFSKLKFRARQDRELLSLIKATIDLSSTMLFAETGREQRIAELQATERGQIEELQEQLLIMREEHLAAKGCTLASDEPDSNCGQNQGAGREDGDPNARTQQRERERNQAKEQGWEREQAKEEATATASKLAELQMEAQRLAEEVRDLREVNAALQTTNQQVDAAGRAEEKANAEKERERMKEEVEKLRAALEAAEAEVEKFKEEARRCKEESSRMEEEERSRAAGRGKEEEEPRGAIVEEAKQLREQVEGLRREAAALRKQGEDMREEREKEREAAATALRAAEEKGRDAERANAKEKKEGQEQPAASTSPALAQAEERCKAMRAFVAEFVAGTTQQLAAVAAAAADAEAAGWASSEEARQREEKVRLMEEEAERKEAAVGSEQRALEKEVEEARGRVRELEREREAGEARSKKLEEQVVTWREVGEVAEASLDEALERLAEARGRLEKREEGRRREMEALKTELAEERTKGGEQEQELKRVMAEVKATGDEVNRLGNLLAEALAETREKEEEVRRTEDEMRKTAQEVKRKVKEAEEKEEERVGAEARAARAVRVGGALIDALCRQSVSGVEGVGVTLRRVARSPDHDIEGVDWASVRAKSKSKGEAGGGSEGLRLDSHAATELCAQLHRCSHPDRVLTEKDVEAVRAKLERGLEERERQGGGDGASMSVDEVVAWYWLAAEQHWLGPARTSSAFLPSAACPPPQDPRKHEEGGTDNEERNGQEHSTGSGGEECRKDDVKGERKPLDTPLAELLGRAGGCGAMQIESVRRESVAAECGINEGDELLEVDGKGVKGQSTEEVERLLGGEAGTAVVVKGRRAGSGEEFHVELVRRGGIVGVEEMEEARGEACRRAGELHGEVERLRTVLTSTVASATKAIDDVRKEFKLSSQSLEKAKRMRRASETTLLKDHRHKAQRQLALEGTLTYARRMLTLLVRPDGSSPSSSRRHSTMSYGDGGEHGADDDPLSPVHRLEPRSRREVEDE